jgi:AmiR/NasT family two-component response regulator
MSAYRALVTATDVGELLAQVAPVTGYEVVLRDLEPASAKATAARERPDVVVVPQHPAPDKALVLVGMLSHEASYPVVAICEGADRFWSQAAIAAGAFGIVVRFESTQLAATLDLARRRFADLCALQAAFGRRAMIEQAKGLLMARHHINDEHAFAMLRAHSQQTNRKLVDVAQSLVRSHHLLVSLPERQLTEAQPQSSAESAQ